MSDEQSKALQAGGKALEQLSILGQDVAKAATSLCHWFGKVLGTAPEDAVGILIADPLAHIRARFGAVWMRRTQEILKKRGVEATKPISPNLLIEAYQGASVNDDETIRELWSRLMANALDPNRDTSLNRQLINALKDFDPDDAIVFAILAEAHRGRGDTTAEAKKRFDRLEWRQSRLVVARQHLFHLGIVPGPGRNTLSSLGIELSLAVSDIAAD